MHMKITWERSAICTRTVCSMAVGSMVASSPRTRIRLLILTFGGGGSSSPCRMRSCFSFSRSSLLCFLIFLVSCGGVRRGIKLAGADDHGCCVFADPVCRW